MYLFPTFSHVRFLISNIVKFAENIYIVLLTEGTSMLFFAPLIRLCDNISVSSSFITLTVKASVQPFLFYFITFQKIINSQTFNYMSTLQREQRNKEDSQPATTINPIGNKIYIEVSSW